MDNVDNVESEGLDGAVLTSVEKASARIREGILTGQYAQGERLKVADLSKHLGFSTMPLREALRILEGEGLVEIQANRGAVVRTLDHHFVEDLFELNTELRIFALKRGIKFMTLARLNQLESLADDYEQAIASNDLDRGLAINREFHTQIVGNGGNDAALMMFQRGWELISAYRRSYGYGYGRQQGLANEKRLLIEAIRRQDLQQAEALLRMQHAAVIEDLLERIAER